MVQWGVGWLNGPMSRWVLACATMVLALIAPALWNGFPIVFYDTGGYLMRPIEATLTMGRSAFYGAFLLLGTSWHFWPNIVLQSALVIWLTLLTLRLHGLGGRPWLAAAIVAGLCALTSLPWYAAQLMPDILLPVFVLSAALLAFHADALQRWERVALIAASAAAIASHMSILALALGVLAALAAIRALPLLAPRSNLALPAAAVVAGVTLALASNLAIAGQFSFTPGGFNFVFSRLVQDGIVHRYLDERCPDPTIKLCEYRAEVPHTANDWLWAEESPIYVLGGFEAFEPQARRIVLDSLMQYPVDHLKTAITSTAKQFVAFATGDALTPWNWSTEFAFERYVPSAFTAYRDTRQAAGPFDFSWINAVHVPLLALAIAALPIIIVTRAGQRIAALATLLLLALLGNAAICGVLSSPSDRYQSRLAWLAALVAAIALIERHLSRQAIPPLTAESLVPSQDEGLPAKT
jgi:hypothetical protein